VLLVVVALLLTLMLSGVRVSAMLQWVVIGGWVVFCFGLVYVRPGFYGLTRMDLRNRRVHDPEGGGLAGGSGGKAGYCCWW
jgi:hypothetical protein